MSAAIQAQVLDPLRLDLEERRAWDRLGDHSLEPNPFLRREFVMAAAHERDDDVELLVVSDGPVWIGLLPFRRARYLRRLPYTCMAPWLPAYSYLATPLIDADRAEAASDALVGAAVTSTGTKALVLDPIDSAGPTRDALDGAFDRHGLEPLVLTEYERAAVRRRPEPTYLSESLSGRSRKKLRASARALTKAAGELTVEDRAGDPDAVVQFLDLESKGWKGKRATALASTPQDRAFFTEMCEAMADREMLQLLTLSAGQKAVAMQCNLMDGPDLYAFKTAYDEDYASFSPGAQLEVASIEAFHEDDQLQTMDSCSLPGSELVERIWPDRRRLERLVVPAKTRGAALLPPLTRLDQSLLKVWRRASSASGPRRAAKRR